MAFDELQPIFATPHERKKLDFRSVTHKLKADQTDGPYDLFDSVFGPGAGDSLHVHRREDEVCYGSLEIRLADQTLILEAGSVAHLPKNIPHAIRNPLETESRCLPATIDPFLCFQE